LATTHSHVSSHKKPDRDLIRSEKASAATTSLSVLEATVSFTVRYEIDSRNEVA
jgi:hypothetical protein